MASPVEHAGHQARHSEALKRGARVGLVAYGIVHLLIAWIALQVAWSGGGEASSGGALTKLAGQPFGQVVLVVGRAGYVAKGVAIGVVGLLFGWSAISYDPEKAGGLDDALKTVREQAFGPYLLTGVALGLAAFGLFCFAWARYVRTR